MEYEAIFLDILSHISEIVQSKLWVVVPTLVHLCHQGFPKAQFLACAVLLYINDNTTNVNSQLCLFADDCLIYKLIASPADHQILQDDLETLDAWFRHGKWKQVKDGAQ